MNIAAWREPKEEDESVYCRLQVTYKDGRKVKSVLRQLTGWDQCGTGYNPKEKEEILIFVKKFKNVNKWKSFLRGFPYKISEVLRNNNIKVHNARKTKGQ
tara:strand:+ start:111 stop:410 length:300 start_codon:yes stop_codon:yes gene_type:complete